MSKTSIAAMGFNGLTLVLVSGWWLVVLMSLWGLSIFSDTFPRVLVVALLSGIALLFYAYKSFKRVEAREALAVNAKQYAKDRQDEIIGFVKRDLNDALRSRSYMSNRASKPLIGRISKQPLMHPLWFMVDPKANSPKKSIRKYPAISLRNRIE